MQLNSLSSFLLLAGAGALALGSAVWRAPSVARVQRLTRLLLFYCAAVGLIWLATTLARTLHFRPFGSAAGVMRLVLIYRAWIPIGAALAGAIGIVITARGSRRGVAPRATVHAYITSPELRQALCISVALGFFAIEIGKPAHDAEMRSFFQASHLPVWLHYAVMAAETTGAFALLGRSHRIPAAVGLSVIMFGAIGTHARNGDPFTDSLEALHMLLLLTCIVALTAFAQRVRLPARSPGQPAIARTI